MKLFSPFSLKNVDLPNRLVMSPMCMYSAENGVANDFHFVHYTSRAQGGVGLIIVEATGVEPKGRITEKCLGLWNDEQEKSLKRIVDFIHQNTDTKMGIQLAHAGRKASTWNGVQIPISDGGWQTLAPSPIPYKPNEEVPKEISISEIQEIVTYFKTSSERAINAGFDVIEIHAAHGYLLHQFLSPKSNVRTDKYGGSFENRIRFLLEVVNAVKETLTEKQALLVRISATDYVEEGWDLQQSIALSKILKENGVDLVDVSSGGNIHNAKISLFDGYQVSFSDEIRKNAEIPTGVVGLINNADFAEEILQSNQADLIFMARELLRNPYFPIQNAMKNNQPCFFPKQYERAKR